MGAVELLLILAAGALIFVAFAIVAATGNEDIRRALDETYRDGSED